MFRNNFGVRRQFKASILGVGFNSFNIFKVDASSDNTDSKGVNIVTPKMILPGSESINVSAVLKDKSTTIDDINNTVEKNAYTTEVNKGGNSNFGSYDPQAQVKLTNTQNVLQTPDKLGTPKQRVGVIQNSLQPVVGQRQKYNHKSPSNTAQITYDILSDQLPKYGMCEGNIVVENIDCTADTLGNYAVQFQVPYLPITMYVKDSYDKSNDLIAAQTIFTPTQSSLATLKYMDSVNSGKYITCNFNQSITDSISMGVESNILQSTGQAIHSVHLNIHKPTENDFIQGLGIEVSNNFQANISYFYPQYNGGILGSEYNVDLMNGRSQVTNFIRLRTNNLRTTLVATSKGQLTGQIEYLQNKFLNIAGHVSFSPSDNKTYSGITLGLNRTIDGEK